MLTSCRSSHQVHYGKLKYCSTVKYQCRSHHPSTAGDLLLLLNKYSVRLCYSESPPDTAVKQFFLQACGGDTPGPWGQRGRESTYRPGWERERTQTETETEGIMSLWMCSKAAIQYCKHAVYP